MPTNEELIKKLGLPTAAGKIKLIRNKFYFVQGRNRKVISPSNVREEYLKRLDGKGAVAVLSDKAVVAIIPEAKSTLARLPRWILCYIPPIDFRIFEIESVLQKTLVEQFVKDQVLSADQGKIIVNDIIGM